MVLLGKVWAAATPDASDAAAIAIQQTRFNMVFSSVRQSDPGQLQLPGKPVGRPAPIAIRTVVGIVPAVLDDQQLHRPRDTFRQALRVRGGHEPVLATGDDEDRAGDRKSTRLNSSHSQISYAVFCLKKKKNDTHARASNSASTGNPPPREDPCPRGVSDRAGVCERRLAVLVPLNVHYRVARTALAPS